MFPSYHAATHPPGSITPAAEKDTACHDENWAQNQKRNRTLLGTQQHRCSMATVNHSVTMLTVLAYESSLGCPGLDLLNEVAVNVGTDRLLVKRGIWDLPLLLDCDLVDFMVAER